MQNWCGTTSIQDFGRLIISLDLCVYILFAVAEIKLLFVSANHEKLSKYAKHFKGSHFSTVNHRPEKKERAKRKLDDGSYFSGSPNSLRSTKEKHNELPGRRRRIPNRNGICKSSTSKNGNRECYCFRLPDATDSLCVYVRRALHFAADEIWMMQQWLMPKSFRAWSGFIESCLINSAFEFYTFPLSLARTVNDAHFAKCEPDARHSYSSLCQQPTIRPLCYSWLKIAYTLCCYYLSRFHVHTQTETTPWSSLFPCSLARRRRFFVFRYRCNKHKSFN